MAFWLCVVSLFWLPVLRTRASSCPASSCPASYGPAGHNEVPLVFGGVYARCLNGCQPRGDQWSALCNPSELANVRTCQPQQTVAVMRAASRVELAANGSASLTPCQLLAYLQHRTLWLIGDSHMRHQYYALRCFLLDLWDHALGECAPSTSPAVNKALWKAADTNHTSLLRQLRPRTDVAKCFHLIKGGRICSVHSVRGEEFAAAPSAPEAPALLRVLQDSLARPEDIFVVNFGSWHFHNCIGLLTNSYTQSLVRVGALYQATRARFPNFIFKLTGHDHTECNAAGIVVNPVTRCLPASQGNYPLSIGLRVMQTAVSVLGRYNVSTMNNYQLSRQLYQAHTIYAAGTMDCLHWCTPGLHELDIWTMYKAFRTHPTIQPAAGQQAGRGNATWQDCLAVTSDRPPKEWQGSGTGSSSSSSSNHQHD